MPGPRSASPCDRPGHGPAGRGGRVAPLSWAAPLSYQSPPLLPAVNRVFAAIPALILLLAVPTPADPVAQPVTQPMCPGAPEPSLAFQWDSQLENLAFDDRGNLVVVDLHGDRLLWLRADGLEGVLDLPASHGIVYNPHESRFYATGVLGAMAGPAGVVSFQLADGFADFRPLAEGLRTVNGMAFGPDGALYASDPLAASPPYLQRIEPNCDYAPWNDRYGPNGLWPADGGLYAAITGDQSSPIVHIGFDGAQRTVAQLSYGAGTLAPGVHAPSGPAVLMPKGLDDLTVGPDGSLYVAAHLAGEVLRVDPADGSACVLASGFKEPTSLRFAPDSWGEHAGDLYVTDMGGVAVTALVGPGQGALWRLDTA